MDKRTMVASRLALKFPEALMVWPEDNLSNLSEEYTHLGSKGLKESFGLVDAVRAADVKACQIAGIMHHANWPRSGLCTHRQGHV